MNFELFDRKIELFHGENFQGSFEFSVKKFQTYHSIVSCRSPVNFDIILFSHIRHHFLDEKLLFSDKNGQNFNFIGLNKDFIGLKLIKMANLRGFSRFYEFSRKFKARQ